MRRLARQDKFHGGGKSRRGRLRWRFMPIEDEVRELAQSWRGGEIRIARDRRHMVA
jgi:hypothetical protein